MVLKCKCIYVDNIILFERHGNTASTKTIFYSLIICYFTGVHTTKYNQKGRKSKNKHSLEFAYKLISFIHIRMESNSRLKSFST